MVADPATIDPRFLLDDAKARRIETVIAETWPETIEPARIGEPALAREVREARTALLHTLELDVLI